MKLVLAELANGPKNYHQLSKLYCRAQLDIFLRVLLGRGQVQLGERGYSLPVPPEPDEEDKPIPPDHRVCITCCKDKPLRAFQERRLVCNSCRYVARRKTCKVCHRDKLPNAFPCLTSRFERGVCYKCNKLRGQS